MVEWIYKLTDISSIKRISFRQDINGLRAIAVLAVVFYHAELELFKGGWLGVDIFFVISGYLISNIIISELNEGTFSFKNFYLRRVRRILPALFSTLLLTIPFAYYLLTPKAMEEYIDSLVASVFFYANYHFMNLDSYVAESTKLMPLMHTWSLAIEEQYYLLFPLFSFTVYKYFKKYFTFFIGLITVGSLYLNTLSESSDKFYRLEFRIWELLLGVLIMILSSNFKIKNLEKIGLPLMLFPIFYFSDNWINDIEPKLLALVGISLIIFSNIESSILTRVLNHKIISTIGLSSYSIYLLHQPIFAFSEKFKLSNFENYKTNNTGLKLQEIIFLLFMIILLGNFSYKKIEIFFLNPIKKLNFQFLFLSLIVLIILLNTIQINTDDFDNSFESNFWYYENEFCIDKNIDDLCKVDNNAKKTIYAIGDSSLSPINNILAEKLTFSKDYNLIAITGRACMFLFSYDVDKNGCLNFDKDELDNYISNIENSIIVYSVSLPAYLNTSGFFNGFVKVKNWDREPINIEFEKEINNTFDILISKNNTIILIYPIPEQAWDVPSIYNNLTGSKIVSYPHELWKQRRNSSILIYDKIQSKKIIKIFPEKIFCDSFVENECVGSINDSIFYMDHYHLSSTGAELVTNQLINVLNFINNNN